jgi:hypothetical protein
VTRRLIVDSGAFGVWAAQGRGSQVSIDLASYVEFCMAYPDASYYVNLDVIPGVPNQKRTLTKAAVEAACQAGWRNYVYMTGFLPAHKLIPVYHQGDPVSWLEKYISCHPGPVGGLPYVGISPANDMTTAQKLQWLKGLRRYLFDGAGRPTCRTHGFAVTSYDLMKAMEWYSVDSASWKLSAAWGCIYLPQQKRGGWDYSKPPLNVAVSPASPALRKKQAHVQNMTPTVRQYVQDYLEEIGVPLGMFSERKVPEGYKLVREETGGELGSEFWISKPKRLIGKPEQKGVTTSFEMRARATSKFMQEANKELPVRYIYFAGAPMPYPLEFDLRSRLLSYHEVGKSNNGIDNRYMTEHCRQVREVRELRKLDTLVKRTKK